MSLVSGTGMIEVSVTAPLHVSEPPYLTSVQLSLANGPMGCGRARELARAVGESD